MLRLRSRATSSTNQASERRLGGGSISAATGKHSRSLSRDGAKSFIKRCIIITLPIKCVFYCYYYFVIVKNPPVVSFTSFLRNMAPSSSLFMSIDVVPSCPASPWKTHEDIRGICDSSSTTTAKTIDECATSCCNDDNCITWQYRRDVGCLHFGDKRLGMEKDGPAAWCSEHPPQKWQGQFLLKEGSIRIDRKVACNEQTWNPKEEVGQCLGLGDVRPNEASASAVQCMKACCDDETCGAWQWNEAVSR